MWAIIDCTICKHCGATIDNCSINCKAIKKK